ncbi:MAG TPA: S8 family serine peptidase [Isosphaeraceae bacterium]
MARSARRRPAPAPRLEALEPRTLLSGAAPGVVPTPPSDPAHGLLVRFADRVPPARARGIVQALGGQVLEEVPRGPTVVALGPGVDRAAVLARLNRDPRVRYAEADGPLPRAAEVVSDDPSLPQQWGLNNPNNIDIDAPQAWQVTTGNPAIVVAVLDTGIDLDHPDLRDRLWVNPAEIPGNGTDDDQNGLIDDVHGWNFVADSNDVQDDNGHGTHIAGILGASGGNDTGVAGVNWEARILPLKILDTQGEGTTGAVVQSVYYAMRAGARVINASWGGATYSRAVADVLALAGANGVVFVTAAGNEAVNNNVVRSYPASYRFANTLSVAAVDAAGRLAGFSNFGRRSVDLAAPGVGILSTAPGGYDVRSGTSMATPFVSGVVALVAGQHPEYSAAQLVQRVLSTTKPLSGRAARTVTGGLVDAAAAVGVSTVALFGRARGPRRTIVRPLDAPSRPVARAIGGAWSTRIAALGAGDAAGVRSAVWTGAGNS